MIYRDELSRMIRSLIDRKADLEKELSALPSGQLYIIEKDGVSNYYQRLPREGNRKRERRVGVKKDPEMLMDLVRKKYVAEALKRVDKDINAVKEALNRYEPFDENIVMDGFLQKHPELTEGIYRSRSERFKEALLNIPHREIYEEFLTSTSADGSSRRSLGEILIGSKLDQYNIPYTYEAIAHPDLNYRPDFKIIRPRDGKIIFWEHIGKVNDASYMAHNKRKLADYESVGIVPWDNLIITYSRMGGGINEKLIDAMIQAWLL